MYRLTKPQQLIYNMEKFAGGAVAVICGSFVKKGTGEPDALKRAVNELFRINDALRTRIVETADGTMQTIVPFAEKDVEILRFAVKTDVEVYAADWAKTPVDISGESLAKIRPFLLPDGHGFIIKVHHLIGDAWSLSLLASQFCEIMDGKMPAAYPYEEYANKEAKYLRSSRYEKDRAFFSGQFKKCDEVTYISEKQTDSFHAVRKSIVIGASESRWIYDYAKAHNTSPFMLFMATLAIYMSRVKMNAETFYIGTAVLNRAGVHEKNTVGMFINTVPLLMELNNEQSFSDNLSGIQKNVLAVFRHQKYNYGDVLTDIRKEYGFSERLYDVMLSYQNATVADGAGESVWYHNGVQAESLQIHIDDRDVEGVFKIQYDYQTEKFTMAQIDSLHEHICSLLFDAIENDGKKLYELEFLTANEKQKLLYDFNDTAADYPRDKCVHTLFEERAARMPYKTAVIACDRTLTYRELNEQANRIAHSIMGKGVGVGDIVAFALPRESYLIAAMLGILKAGAAYLPIDTGYPQERIDYMMADSGAKLCITEENVAEFFTNEGVENPNVAVSGEDLCYCIYTSGSTGTPKGAQILHRSLSNFCNDTPFNSAQKYIRLNCSAVLAFASISFDIAVFETVVSLLLGKRIVMANEREMDNPMLLAEFLRKHPVDCVHCTPTKLLAYLKSDAVVAVFSQVKCAVIGGERFTQELFDFIGKVCTAKIFNGYGPAETTIGVCFSAEHPYVTIGKPIANTQIYIVDNYLRPVPIGVTGELCIAGDGVGAGYLNRPELTAEKFIDNPFGEGKLYRTGDLAYWREDGNIVYVGRNDFQVKIRGLRIELGEIENAISALEGVSQAVAVVRKDDGGRQLICAFYTGAELPAKEIRARIGQKLPKYMLPHIFTHLEKMPLTPSGKVNRKALPEVDWNDAEGREKYVRPEGQLEKRLAALMGKVLKHTPIGRDDDFFDFGGDSLSAIEFVSLAHSEGIYFTVQSVFDNPTVRQLAAYIEKDIKPRISFAETDFVKINEILARNKEDAVVSPPVAVPLGDMLLAGATGFLGAHILADYLDHDEGTAYCLVRGKDQVDSEARLRETLQFYFGGRYDDTRRFRVICADLEKERFGLSVTDYDELGTHIDTVVNAAASVKHYGPYKYFHAANVETVKRLIAFCKEIDAKLIHVSTLSVSGKRRGDQFDGYVSETDKHFYESSLYIGQSLENVYVRSKFEAETRVLDAMERGLRANIMRMGNLTNRASDGVFQKNYETNMFLRHVKAFMDIGAFPDDISNMPIDITPVDEAATAIMTLVRHFDESRTVFHVANTNALDMGDFLALLGKASSPIQCVSREAFVKALRADIKSAEIFSADLDANGNLRYKSGIELDSRFTSRYLKKLGFVWSEIGVEYLRKYVEWLRGIGYLCERKGGHRL